MTALRTTDRIVTTHAGSLPRPRGLVDLVMGREAGEDVDAGKLSDEVRSAVEEVARQQAAAGVDVLNDGEFGKAAFVSYAVDRLSGFVPDTVPPADGFPNFARWMGIAIRDFPDFAERLLGVMGSAVQLRLYACDGPVSYIGHEQVAAEIATLRTAAGAAGTDEVFMTAASPGLLAQFAPNRHYATEEDYLFALAEAMRVEYEAIHAAGFVLQVDCPDLAMVAPVFDSVEDFRRQVRMRVEALNHALSGIPAEAVRMHVCWGGGEMPRTTDIGLHEIIDDLLPAKPAGLMVMAANGRHAHEWEVFAETRLPDGKYLIPGMVDIGNNVVEHPEWIAQRLVQYAGVVGRENVVAGTDCGFGPVAGMDAIAPTVVWAKFRAMSDGARIATERLWK
ncbi:cobalamin-independent methionine synthase II family protein [Actinoplanes sp. NPDC049265]|uniref:cobalamin-independent methionine synthase II family protein n=1 Tax=Actinoplanes sp. NPDC049265 TaxID=3363902 RepID=UPI0037101F3E